MYSTADAPIEVQDDPDPQLALCYGQLLACRFLQLFFSESIPHACGMRPTGVARQ